MGSGGPKAPGASPIQMGGAGSFNSVNTPYQPPSAGPVPNWMEGGKFTARDAIGLALAAFGDNIGPRGGSMMPMMMQHRMSLGEEGKELDKYRKKKEIDQEFDSPDLPPIVRDAQAWKDMPEELKKAYTELADRQNPIVRTGPDGLPYAQPRIPQLPPGYDPDEWEVVPDPTGGAAPTAPAPFSPQGGGADYGQFKQAIIGQESGGRYGVPNAEGSGAMGIGQVMPDTARALAERIGVPYRPELMSGTGPQARQYQDAITEAAVQEAWKAGGSGKDPVTAAMYYHGGSNRKIWGPRTKRYAQNILGRMGNR